VLDFKLTEAMDTKARTSTKRHTVRRPGLREGFDASRWVGEWLERPLPALGGAKPAEYMDTMEGQELISRLLAQAQSGAYA
jgi:hypothetical protein